MLAVNAQVTTGTAAPKPLSFTNGNGSNGHSFEGKAGYSVEGRLTFRRPAHIDQTIDLRHGFVVPPFGEAHNHNVETLNRLTIHRQIFQHGIFYVVVVRLTKGRYHESVAQVDRLIDMCRDAGRSTGLQRSIRPCLRMSGH